MFIEERNEWMRETRGCEDCRIEIAKRVDKELVAIRKDCEVGREKV